MTSRAGQDPEYQLPAVEGIPNGEMGAAMDLGQLQKEKQDLEQQLLEKNKVRLRSTSAAYVSFPVFVPKTLQSLLQALC